MDTLRPLGDQVRTEVIGSGRLHGAVQGAAPALERVPVRERSAPGATATFSVKATEIDVYRLA